MLRFIGLFDAARDYTLQFTIVVPLPPGKKPFAVKVNK
jgi:hypothetical protein